MACTHLDLADPHEGERLAAALRAAGFEVVERPVEALRGGTDAALAIVGADVEGLSDVLEALRHSAGTANMPVLLVACTEEPPSSGLVVDRLEGRPVDVNRLVDKVRRFFAPAGAEQPGIFDDPEGSSAKGPIEPTMELEGESESGGAGAEAELPMEQSDVRRAEPAADGHAQSGIAVARGAGEAEEDSDASGAELSPQLRRMLVDADQRLFPDSAPLNLGFPGGDEAPGELVPDELLEVASIAIDPVAEDPFDAFTFIGLPPEQMVDEAVPPPSPSSPGDLSGQAAAPREAGAVPAASDAATRGPPRSDGQAAIASTEEPPETQGDVARAHTVDSLEAGKLSTGGVGRRGQLGPGEVVALLWRLADQQASVQVRFARPESQGDLTLVLRDGWPVDIQAPVASAVLEQLRTERRLDESALDEEQAMSVLDRRVHAGLLGRLELARRLRRQRERALYTLIECECSYAIHPHEGGSAPVSAPAPAAGTLPGLLVEGSRRRVGMEQLRAWWGGGPWTFHLGPHAQARFRQIGLEPEIIDLLTRHADGPLEGLLAEAADDDGVPGLVYALSSVDALRVVPGPPRGELQGMSLEAVRQSVESAVELAEEGGYFDILGIGPDASAREVRVAYEARRGELEGLPLVEMGLHALESKRASALEAIEEAYELLRVPRWRQAYARALGA
jgi:hypothetical protein